MKTRERNNREMSGKDNNDFLKELAKSLPNDEAVNLAKENGSFRSYYLPTWGDNVWGGTMSSDFQKMYNEGDGNELLCKACAIHSSSMLAYNFFHWINDPEAVFKFREIEFDRVVFEVKIPCLWKSKKGKPARTENFVWEDFVCANMDIMLVGKKDGKPHVFFFESKFTEHFSSSSSSMLKMKSAYNDKGRYIVPSYDMPAVVKEFKDKARMTNKRKAYYDGIKQSICHLIAITNLVADKRTLEAFARKYRIDESSTFHFANLLYRPAERFRKESRYYEEYCEIYKEFYGLIGGKYPESGKLDVFPSPLSYTDIWSVMKGQINPELKGYLEDRYMKVAYNPDKSDVF